MDGPGLIRSTSYRSLSESFPSSMSHSTVQHPAFFSRRFTTREQSSKATNELAVHIREASKLWPRPLAGLRWPRNQEAFRSRRRWVPGRPRPITLHRTDIQSLNIWELRRSLFKIQAASEFRWCRCSRPKPPSGAQGQPTRQESFFFFFFMEQRTHILG